MTLSYTSISCTNTYESPPNLLEIYELVTIIQKVFPIIFIISNRAEQFKGVPRPFVSYCGRKTLEKATNRLLSWILFKYYQKGLTYFLVRNPTKIPMSILQKSYHLQFNSTIFK